MQRRRHRRPSRVWGRVHNLVWERFSSNQRLCVASPRLSLGGIHPQVPLRFTWGYSWCRLFEARGGLWAASTTYVSVESALQALIAKLCTLNKISLYSACSVVTKCRVHEAPEPDQPKDIAQQGRPEKNPDTFHGRPGARPPENRRFSGGCPLTPRRRGKNRKKDLAAGKRAASEETMHRGGSPGHRFSMPLGRVRPTSSGWSP